MSKLLVLLCILILGVIIVSKVSCESYVLFSSEPKSLLLIGASLVGIAKVEWTLKK